MAEFEVTVDARAPAAAVWALVTDWPAHSRFVALTTVRHTRGPDGGPAVGDRFVGRTGVGRLAFDDPMEVVELAPPSATAPGRCVLAKLGAAVLGRAVIEVTPTGPATSSVSWSESIEIAPVRLTRHLAPVVSAAGSAAFGRVLRAMVAEVERGHR